MIPVKDHADNYHEIDENKTLFDFKAGDIFLNEDSTSAWDDKICVIAGVNAEGIWYRLINNETTHRRAPLKMNHILLERPGLKYKVGDLIEFNRHDLKVLVINPQSNEYFLSGHAAYKDSDAPIPSREITEQSWWPKKLKDQPVKGRWFTEAEIEARIKVEKNKEKGADAGIDDEIAVSGIPEGAKNKMPRWFSEMMLKHKAGIAHLFILWGNIYDLQKNMRGEYLTLYQYLAEIFEQRDLIMFYSLSSGLQFANEDMEKLFRSRFLDKNAAPTGDAAGMSATEGAASGLRKNQAANAPLSQLLGERPEQVLKFIGTAITDRSDTRLRSALIIDFAHNIAPNQIAGHNAGDRISAEILERWAKDERIKEAGNTVILVTPSLANLAEGLRSPQGEAAAVRIPKPNEDERTNRWRYNHSLNGVEFSDGLTPEHLGRITSGLSYKQIDAIYRLAKEQKIPVSSSLVKEKKQDILETEFGERIKVKMPKWGFNYFGGKEYLKRYGREINENILSGMWRRAPMGILASGPPGTGKTFFFECLAFECGFNFVEIANPRSMWVGQSEEIAEKIFAALDDLAPVIVLEDEADQSETPRDTPNGDSGVSNRLRQMKFKFTSDPARRGKVIWVRISNRPDLIDTAYKREGRSDDTIPFLMPNPDEYADIFKVMFARYEIPTDIKDFAQFANAVSAKGYCTGASVEWMVLEADKHAGRDGIDKVDKKHLDQALSDWEMKINPREVDRQIILAIEGSSKRLRPDNWETILGEAKGRLYGEQATAQSPSVFPGLGKTSAHA